MIGLALLTGRAWRIDIPERQLYLPRSTENTARAFMATDDLHVFDNKPKAQLLSYRVIPWRPACAMRRSGQSNTFATH